MCIEPDDFDFDKFLVTLLKLCANGIWCLFSRFFSEISSHRSYDTRSCGAESECLSDVTLSYVSYYKVSRG